MARTKHLGRTFGKWTVTRTTRDRDGRHYRYYLTRKTHDGAVKTVAITNVAMTKLGRGEITMHQLLKGKQFQRDRFPSRAYRNSVWYTFNTNGSLE